MVTSNPGQASPPPAPWAAAGCLSLTALMADTAVWMGLNAFVHSSFQSNNYYCYWAHPTFPGTSVMKHTQTYRETHRDAFIHTHAHEHILTHTHTQTYFVYRTQSLSNSLFHTDPLFKAHMLSLRQTVPRTHTLQCVHTRYNNHIQACPFKDNPILTQSSSL